MIAPVPGGPPHPTTGVDLPCLGLHVTPMTPDHIVEWIDGTTSKALILNHNLHSAYLTVTDPEFATYYELADLTLIDGAPILWLARARRAYGLTSRHRTGSTDWLSSLPNARTPGRLFVYGATSASSSAAISKFRSALGPSGWEVSGTNGYVDATQALSAIRAFRPTMVIVGLGMPLQEAFLARYWDDLPPAVYATVGGAIDQVSGIQTLAPRWIGRIGLEWAWRLAHNPRRLAGRYLIEPVKLVWAVSVRHGLAIPSAARRRRDAGKARGRELERDDTWGASP